MRNLVFVVDIRNWAFDQVAKNLKNNLSDQFNIEILYWEDYAAPIKFLEEINKKSTDIIHFFYREQINILLNTFSKNNELMKKFCKKTITTHVPDYLFNDQISLSNRYKLFNFINGYFTTNRDLFNIYTESGIVPKPSHIIFDWVKINTIPSQKNNKSTTILWVGNSKWGEYAGYKDYKGLQTIIEPAIDAIRNNFSNFEFLCLDSSKEKIAHDEVLKFISKANILLIASSKEGTPLPLLEAMASKCAVISTNVGIAAEILPQEQHPYLIERTPEAFVVALSKLISSPEKTMQLGELNHQKLAEIYADNGPLRKLWIEFIEQAEQKNTHARVQKKLALLSNENRGRKKLVVNTLRYIAKLANKTGTTGSINKLSPRFGQFYHKYVHGGSSNKINYNNLDQIYDKQIASISQEDPIVIYSPMWKGVASSTKAIFPHNSIPFPFTDAETPEVKKHHYADTIAQKIARSNNQLVIFSGGSQIHYELANKIKVLAPQKRQYFMWHGSPAQWLNHHEKSYFLKWKNAHDQNIISGFITLKFGLDKILNRMGVETHGIFNPIPNINEASTAKKITNEEINVGVFSAINSWYKNPYPQILSLTNRTNINLTTNIEEKDIKDVLKIHKPIHYTKHLGHSDFLNILKEQHINIYITNTECSPMIALESWSYLIPCLVSPAGDVYSRVSKELGSWLVEPRVDDAEAISKRLDLVINHYDVITKLLLAHREKYREVFFKEKRQLLDKL